MSVIRRLSINTGYYCLPAFFLLLICCKNRTDSKNQGGIDKEYRTSTGINDEDDDCEYSDGSWCADVEYYNPNTGTRNTYSLDVEVESGELVKINWPNGGWLDESHFSAENISSGECSFTSDRGYEYTVSLKQKGACNY